VDPELLKARLEYDLQVMEKKAKQFEAAYKKKKAFFLRQEAELDDVVAEVRRKLEFELKMNAESTEELKQARILQKQVQE